MTRFSLLVSLVAATALLACGPSGTATPVTPAPPTTADEGTATEGTGTEAAAQASLDTQGLSLEAINRQADPCQDFYEYACGGWLAATEIPGDQAMWSRFHEVYQRNEQELLRILEQEVASGSKVGTYYAACLDEEAIEALGTKPLEPMLAEISKLRKAKQITEIVTAMHAYGSDVLWDHDIDADFVDATLMITHMMQGGLGLPDRDYYLNDDDRSKELLAFYRGHVERTLALAGFSPREAKRGAADVVWLETELAKISMTRVQMREMKDVYNRVDLAGLSKLAPRFGWKAYFTGMGVPDLTTISVSSKKFFAGIDNLIKTAGMRRWKAYLAWHAIRDLRAGLPKNFRDERFAMVQKLSGQKEQRPRWKVCVAETTEALRDLVGQSFVATMFGGDAKQAAVAMVHAISDAFATTAASYDWMDDATRAKALEKRAMMSYLIGYPDKWEDYPFEVSAGQFLNNHLAAYSHERSRTLQLVGKPVDRNQWAWPASIVNAFYHPLRNQMLFPAGILQPPFYSASASIPANLGAIGMIVGHELTHGFDDSGADFGANGNRENWWTEETAKTFKAKQQCVIDKYNAYEVLPGLNVNGELTLGENIADMGGVKLAYMAYRKLRERATPVIADGYTEDQQYFLAVGQAWCTKGHEETIRQRVVTDTHAPAEFRVNGSLSSLPEFAEAFACAKGTPMNPENVCTVW